MTFREFLKALDLVTKIRRRVKKRRKCLASGLPPPSLFSSFEILEADLAHDPGKPTLIIGLHEASRTGAPLLGLNLGEALASTHNIFYWLGNYGPILEDLKRHSFLVVVGFDSPTQMKKGLKLALARTGTAIHGAICNSVETCRLAQAMDELDIPTVGLLHEFGEYTFPRSKLLDFFLACDRIIVPGRLLADSARSHLKDRILGEPRNLAIRPQGLLTNLPEHGQAGTLTAQDILARIQAPKHGPRPKIVLGAGFVHARKGVDLFLQVASMVRKRYAGDFRFIWVGAGARPDEDLNYTFWLHDSVARQGLQDTVCFIDIQRDLKPLLELTDVFFLASRLDPFPNVVIDALASDCHVVCFEGSTSAAEFLQVHEANASVVGYLDLEAAAQAVCAEFQRGGQTDRRNSRIVQQQLHFPDYADFVVAQLKLAHDLKELRRVAIEAIAASGWFDHGFAAGTNHGRVRPERILRDFVTAELRGFHQVQPRPGFNAIHYRAEAGLTDGTPRVSLLHALKAQPGTPPATHSVELLDGRTEGSVYRGRAALHLHLFHCDLAEEFADQLVTAGQTMDVFITADSDPKLEQARKAFSRYPRGRLLLRKVPNRGRDIGPLLTGLKEELRGGGYDVIGHLHGKKSPQFPAEFGETWRQFLVQTLVGDAATLSKVLGLFADDPGLGLVFPEDNRPVDWGDNLPVAAKLAGRMKVSLKLPKVPIFPVGTMFWARPQALASLWDLDLAWTDYPEEPLPGDGSLLHAIERLLPSLAEASGLRWKTLHRDGYGR